MTTLYRSPNVVLDRHEWHVAVRKNYGRTTTQYYFRPLSLKAFRWQPITLWVGLRPKGFWNKMAPYRRHALIAMRSEPLRQFAIEHLPRHSAASLRNSGEIERVAA